MPGVPAGRTGRSGVGGSHEPDSRSRVRPPRRYGPRRLTAVRPLPPRRRRRTPTRADDGAAPSTGAQVLLRAGVRAIVQPGGSVRDGEVIAAVEQAGVPMLFTGERHFFH